MLLALVVEVGVHQQKVQRDLQQQAHAPRRAGTAGQQRMRALDQDGNKILHATVGHKAAAPLVVLVSLLVRRGQHGRQVGGLVVLRRGHPKVVERIQKTIHNLQRVQQFVYLRGSGWEKLCPLPFLADLQTAQLVIPLGRGGQQHQDVPHALRDGRGELRAEQLEQLLVELVVAHAEDGGGSGSTHAAVLLKV